MTIEERLDRAEKRIGDLEAKQKAGIVEAKEFYIVDATGKRVGQMEFQGGIPSFKPLP